MGQGEVGRLPDCRIASWYRGGWESARLSSCQLRQGEVRRVPYYGVAS